MSGIREIPQELPTRDEAVREDPPRIWLEPVDWSQPFAGDERTWCEDKVWPEGDDQGEPTEYIRADLASAPAPASGGVADRIEYRMRVDFEEEAAWSHWIECDAGTAFDIEREPKTNGYQFEVRRLYALPKMESPHV